MALIAMAVHDTEENGRTAYTEKTLASLTITVDLFKHRLIIVDNGSCDATKELYDKFSKWHQVVIIWNKENLGTAAAINKAWQHRGNQNCVKIDNDVVIHSEGWVEQMAEVIARDPSIGQVGLKRKDCWESPERTDFYKSELKMLPHKPGEKWIVVEEVAHVMGTCVMHSSALLDKVGYLYQPALYGFDDSLMSYRSKLAGFRNVFLPHIEIDHIDTGATPYQAWKEKHASEQWKAYHEQIRKYQEHPESIYYNPYL